MEASDKTVLLVSCLPPPMRGVEVWTQTVIEKKLPGGYKLSLIDTSKRYKTSASDLLGNVHKEIWRNLAILIRLLFALTSSRPSIVHLNCFVVSPRGMLRDLLCLILSRLFLIPTVTHFHSTLIAPKRPAHSRLWGFCLEFIVWFSRACIVQNEQSNRAILSLKLYANQKIVVSPCFTVFESRITTQPEKRSSHPLSAVFVGVLCAEKGYEELLAIAGLRPQIEFNLIGVRLDGEDAGDGPLPGNVVLHGEVSQDAVWDALCDADLFIFPSHLEGFPIAVLEAMAAGLPIIATRVGAIPEMIEQGIGGYLVHPGDISGLLSALDTLAENESLRIRMGKHNAQSCKSRYSYKRAANSQVGLYDDLLKRGR
ncbi:MAG: glycosyltransferase family 4 protein [Acidobacteriota bacterium]